MPDRFPIEGVTVTPAEATTLCVYHLRMAAVLFQIVPEDGNRSLYEEIERAMIGDEFAKSAARLWADQMLTLFDAEGDNA